MKRPLRLALGLVAVAVVGHLTSVPSRGQPPDGGEFPFPGEFRRPDPMLVEFQSISKGAKTHEGLFKLYHKDDKVYAELLPHHMGKQLLCPIAVARGAGMGGSTLNFDDQWVVYFKRAGDKVHLVRRNVHHKANAGTPTALAVDITYTDSVLLSLRIAGLNQMTQGVLINLNDIFMSDFGELGIGRFDSSRSVWHKVKAFPKNLELQIQATYAGGRANDGVIDDRGTTVVVHYGLVELPSGGYQPRVADDRVGHFITAVKDFSSTSKDTTFVRYVNRWRLEPSEPAGTGRLSVPKRSIKFYIEKTVPHEFRAAVQEGILEWNKAFEKIGFRNAIEVVQQRDDEEFDPEDMNYNTFRWITTDNAFAIGPSRANPLTGEILDADILFDADFIRYWKQERKLQGADGKSLEAVSPLQALDAGLGLDHDLLNRTAGWAEPPRARNPEAARLAAIRQGVCDCRGCLKMELGMAAMSLADVAAGTDKDPKDKGPKDKDAKDKGAKDKDKEKDKALDEMINQAIKWVVMHEVGHTLGLRHNFKGSTMLTSAQLHDKAVTGTKGLTGSVMDYLPVNLAPKGVKQGDYFPTCLGPYDYWAIEYAYKPLSSNEAEELKKIAARGASTPGLDYGTDEDTVLTADPLINRFDLGDDVLAFARSRMLTTEDLLKTMATRAVEDGEGHQRVRVAFGLLLSQYGNGAYLMSKYVGGEHAYRDHRNDPSGRDPLVPVDPAKQREALKFLQEHVFSDKPFEYPPELLRKLAVDRWTHWGADFAATDFPLYDRVLGIQRLALNQLLNPRALQRVQVNALKAEKGAKPVTVAEVFRSTTDAVWADLPAGKKDKEHPSSIVRRNLQREHLKKLSGLVLGEKSVASGIWFSSEMFETRSAAVPPDARSLARYHLREIGKRIDAALAARPADADETTVAHLEECKERIAKVLSASMQAND
ncbi:zinc-dependent metalloprotease [Frigoriglobus tundricola]|uniref:EcxA zinc-binding domain-containing protein n=1 Tax=Frigoriglobus tundricola TaxID=2774151 RepID=A0A6M5Z067_9BACT|nr:zinc-dependent metalloprotease [Frigoriglobus tundricola]QJW99106.1 hypothetical protein FTUN_6704 [Frigoriglobus tundricola]